MTVAEIMKEVSYQWSQMDKQDKQPYVHQAMEDKVRYENEIRNLKESRGTKSAKHSSSELDKSHYGGNSDDASQGFELKKKPTPGKEFSISLISYREYAKASINNKTTT